MLVDAQGRIGLQTPSAAWVLGYENGELDGSKTVDTAQPDDTRRVQAFIDDAVARLDAL